MILLGVLTLFAILSTEPQHSHVPEVPPQAQVAISDLEQEQAASEFNHRVAGIALIAIAVLVIIGQYSTRLSFLRYACPLLFAAIGIFLAAWSDAEIWPRGSLSWTWLIDHDSEARQHKIYAILLLAMAVVEYLRVRNKLPSRFWRTWSFPMLALIGASLLAFHAHSGTSGLPQSLDPAQALPQGDSAEMSEHQHHSAGSADHSASTSTATHDEHAMTPEALRVQRQHFWMMVTGIAIAVLKVLADGQFIQSRVVLYLWPTVTAILGCLLIGYKE